VRSMLGLWQGAQFSRCSLNSVPSAPYKTIHPLAPTWCNLVCPPKHRDVDAVRGLSSHVHQVPHQELPFPRPVARLPHVLVLPLVSLLRRQQVSQRQRHLPLQHLGSMLTRLDHCSGESKSIGSPNSWRAACPVNMG
jgi:hypothetical protein